MQLQQFLTPEQVFQLQGAKQAIVSLRERNPVLRMHSEGAWPSLQPGQTPLANFARGAERLQRLPAPESSGQRKRLREEGPALRLQQAPGGAPELVPGIQLAGETGACLLPMPGRQQQLFGGGESKTHLNGMSEVRAPTNNTNHCPLPPPPPVGVPSPALLSGRLVGVAAGRRHPRCVRAAWGRAGKAACGVCVVRLLPCHVLPP